MKKLFLTTLLAAQGIFATQGVAQEKAGQAKDTVAKEVSRGKLAVVFETFSWRATDYPVPPPVPVSDTRFSLKPGIGLEYRLSNHFHISAGFFRGNDWKSAAYTMVGVETGGKKPVGVGADIGAIGWRGASTLVIMPYVRLGSRDGKLNVKLTALQAGPRDPLAFGAQVRWNLGKR